MSSERGLRPKATFEAFDRLGWPPGTAQDPAAQLVHIGAARQALFGDRQLFERRVVIEPAVVQVAGEDPAQARIVRFQRQRLVDPLPRLVALGDAPGLEPVGIGQLETQFAHGLGEPGLLDQDLPVQGDHLRDVLPGPDAALRPRPEIEVPGLGIAGRRGSGLRRRGAARERLAQRARDRHGDLGLDLEHVFRRELAIEGLGPQVLVARRVDQLRGDPHALARALHGALEQVRHAQFLADLAHLLGGVAVLHHRGARDHLEVGIARELGQQVVVHAVDEVGGVGLGAAIGEGKHGNGALLRLRRCRGVRRGRNRPRGGIRNRRIAGRDCRSIDGLPCPAIARPIAIGRDQRHHRHQRDPDQPVHALRGLRRDRLVRRHFAVALESLAASTRTATRTPASGRSRSRAAPPAS